MSLNDGRVITNFIKSFMNNEELTILAKGSKRIVLLYFDLLSGLIKLAKSDVNVTQPINLGNREIRLKSWCLHLKKLQNDN